MISHQYNKEFLKPQSTENKSILIVDTDEVYTQSLSKQLKKSKCKVEHIELADYLKRAITQMSPDMIFIDINSIRNNRLFVQDYLELSRKICLMSFDALSKTNAEIFKGFKFIQKPIDVLYIGQFLEDSLAIVTRSSPSENNVNYQENESHASNFVDMLGDSVVMKQIKEKIIRFSKLQPIAQEEAPPVIIFGETGTGKDVSARFLHQHYCHNLKPFIHVDCSTIPKELFESELFGHERGAFTSAQGSKEGLIQSAQDGTLFLDEIGELPLEMQAKFLNVLERRMVRRIGSNKETRVGARIVAATNRDLTKMVNEGSFRSDLFYRLNVLTITMPPLRERGNDKVLLALNFMREIETKFGLCQHEFSHAAVDKILTYNWPGNIRELKNKIMSAVLMNEGRLISQEGLGLPADNVMCEGIQASSKSAASLILNQFVGIPPNQESTPSGGLTLGTAEKMLIEDALLSVGFNVSKAARKLGISRMAMRYRMAKHGFSTNL